VAERPDDERFHFGYTRFEPLLNVFKSLFILLSCGYALSEAVHTLRGGGNVVDLGLAIIYSAVAAAGGLIIGLYMKKTARRIKSGLLELEAVEWMVDSFLSAGILGGFLIAWALSFTPLAHWIPFVDPVLLILIAVLALPAPLRALWSNFRELIDMAPPPEYTRRLDAEMDKALEGLAVRDYEYRLMKSGRSTFMLVHLMVADDFKVGKIEELDAIRDGIEEKILKFDGNIIMEILFIKDRAWAQLR
jgi:cation diffusion facilitator family transporter